MKYEKDPYQVDYALIQDVEILVEGTWNWQGYDEEFLNEIALTYDPAMLRAKVARDHDYYGPAFGHVLALHVKDDVSAEGAFSLVATVGFLESGKAMVESGEYNERSIGWASFHPTPGFPYLWEFSLLGANTPAAVGMEPIIFKEEDAEKMTRQLEIDRVNEGQSLDAIANQLAWEKTEEYIRHQVRQPSRFIEKKLRTVELDEEAGIMAKVGKLKPEYIPEGSKASSMVIQNVMFSLDKDWTLAKAKAWIGERNLAALDVIIASVVAFQDLAMADEEMEWDNDAAEDHRREYAGGEDDIDWDKYREGFLWYDSDEKEKFGSYKLPIADVVDGDLKAVPRGVFAAAGAIGGARGGVDIPDDDVAGVKSHLEKYYDKMDRKAPWQKETSGDAPDGAPDLAISKTTEGGKAMSEKVADGGSTTVIEKGSTANLAAENAAIREEKERQEQLTQEKLLRENTELNELLESAKLEAIKSDVRTMHAEGYITAAQVEMGLVDALAVIPDKKIVVGDRERSAVDIIKDVLMYGGKLKLKLEIAKDILNEDSGDPLVKARAHGIDTAVEERRRQLMRDNPEMSYTEALDRATMEVKK